MSCNMHCLDRWENSLRLCMPCKVQAQTWTIDRYFFPSMTNSLRCPEWLGHKSKTTSDALLLVVLHSLHMSVKACRWSKATGFWKRWKGGIGTTRLDRGQENLFVRVLFCELEQDDEIFISYRLASFWSISDLGTISFRARILGYSPAGCCRSSLAFVRYYLWAMPITGLAKWFAWRQ